MNLRHLEIFNAIMIAGSATKAAKLLKITQPAISTMLAQCESDLGIKLFERNQGRLYPTPEAHALFPDIANIFRRVETVSRIAADLAQGRQGHMTIAATFSMANGLLASAVATFLASQPNVEISIHALPTSRVIECVAQREVDFGLGFGPVSHPDVTTEILARSEVKCVMLPAHPLAALHEVRIEALDGHSVIAAAPDTALGRLVEQALQTARIRPGRRLHVNYSMTAGIMASKGAGVALLEPRFGDIASLSALVSRPLLPRIPLEVVSIEPLGRPRSRATQLLLEAVRDEAGRMDGSTDETPSSSRMR